MEQDRSSNSNLQESKKKQGDSNIDATIDEDLKFYLSGLFNIETSPVYRNLEQLKGKKDVPNERYIVIFKENRLDFLRDCIKSLHASLLAAAEYEKLLGKKVKQIFQDVSNQRMESDKAMSKQFSQNAEIGELKRELLKV